MRSRVGRLFGSTRSGMVGAQRVNHFGVVRQSVPHANTKAPSESVDYWLRTVRSKGMLLEMVPDNMRTQQMCDAAVYSDPLAIKHVPPQLLHEAIIVDAVSRNFKAFFLVPKILRTEKVYLALAHHQDFTMALNDHNLISKDACMFAIKFNSAQVNHAPEKFKPEIDAYLAGVKYLIVRQVIKQDLEEVKFSAISYAMSEKRKSISLCAYPVFAADAVKMLSDKGASDVNLVFIGHKVPGNEPFAFFHTQDVVTLLEQYPIINKVTFLGCRTIDSAQLDREADMVRKLCASTEDNKCGLILLDELPDESQYAGLLAKTKLSRTFVMTKGELLHLEIDDQGQVSAKLSKLDTETYELINRNLGPDKTYKFRKDSEKMIVRNHMSPLSPSELKALNKVSDGTERFTKAHPQYKSDKSKYPFLAKFTIDRSEKDKLKPSHVLKLIDAVEASDKITRDIVIKGYPNRISVDQVHQSNISTEDDIFKLSKFDFFNDRLDRARLAKMRESAVRKMQISEVGSDKTQAKSIEYVVRKHH